MRSTLRVCVGSAILLAQVACGQDDLPGGPSDLIQGVTIYEHANFQGDSAHLTSSVPDLEHFKGPCEHETSSGDSLAPTSVSYDWNDCVSSIRVAPGWRVQAYRDDDYSGQSLTASSDVANLQLVPGTCDHEGLNDCVTSLRVIAPTAATRP